MLLLVNINSVDISEECRLISVWSNLSINQANNVELWFMYIQVLSVVGSAGRKVLPSCDDLGLLSGSGDKGYDNRKKA